MKKLIALVVCMTLSGCITLSKFHTGDIVRARNFINHPQYNNTLVIVTGELKWRWVKEAHTLKVYEITTPDGQTLAAQEFQLQKVDL